MFHGQKDNIKEGQPESRPFDLISDFLHACVGRDDERSRFLIQKTRQSMDLFLNKSLERQCLFMEQFSIEQSLDRSNSFKIISHFHPKF